jgi:adsorption protein A
MKLSSGLLALFFLIPVTASAQTPDLAADLTGYTRYVVYPHLQKGWESMQRGDRDRALAELERARSLAPQSAAVALHLAAAYKKFGEAARAESLLREQLTRTPGDERLRSALTELRVVARQPPAAVPNANACTEPVKAASCRGALPSAQRADEHASIARAAEGRIVGTSPNTPVPKRASGQRLTRMPQPPAAMIAPTEASTGFRTGLSVALQARRFDDAQREVDALLAREPGSAALLDELTYKLVGAGAAEQAVRVLLRAYPFDAGTPAERDTLLQRLTYLIHQKGVLLDRTQLLPLRTPLDTAALRSRQAAFWANLEDCAAVRGVLNDMSSEYGYDDWMRLGDCSIAGAPSIAQQAYARAHAIAPGGPASRALAYQAHAAGEYVTALDAWRSVGAERLSGDDLLAAVTTALAARQNDQAANWLASYRERGMTLNHRYWSLVADSCADGDVTSAITALEHAIAVHPEIDDYLRLARLEHEPSRQLRWLERAADIDRQNANIQAELGYAYARAGRPASALLAFEHAAALDPDDMHVQSQLGFAYWTAGRAADAERVFERVWHADPTNLTVTRQLVYVDQRLKHNQAARWYAERVLDALSSFGTASTDRDTDDTADRRFAFQRLHEELARRVTINLDGWTGTAVGTGTTAAQAGSRYRSYSQLEADFRLGSPPVRDGSTLSAYARVLADGGDQRSVVPSQNGMLGVGLRWKPLRNQVIYFAAEKQIALEDPSRRDVLLRASASFLNGGRYGDDWHASGSGWLSQNIYFDAAQYLQTNHSAFTADYRESYHRKLSASATLEPYSHLQFNGAKNADFQRDVRSGAGLRWNVWYGATRYDAAPHKVSVGLEFQHAFETYLSDRNGLFLTLSTRW